MKHIVLTKTNDFGVRFCFFFILSTSNCDKWCSIFHLSVCFCQNTAHKYQMEVKKAGILMGMNRQPKCIYVFLKIHNNLKWFGHCSLEN